MKKKSKYIPKPIRFDNLLYVKYGMLKVTQVPSAGLNLLIINHESFDEILKGNPTKDHVDDLVHSINMTEILAFDFRIGSDWLPEIMDAQDALYHMAQRGISGKSFRFTGEEIKLIQVALAIHDEQLKVCDVRTMEKALNKLNVAYMNKQARVIVPLAAANEEKA